MKITVFVLASVGLLLGGSVDSAQGQWCQANEFDKLLASDGQPNDHFGMDIDVCGNTAVIGTPQNYTGTTEPGMAYVFEKIDGVWVEVAKLTASDGVANDRFGRDVACNGDTVVVGAIYHEDHGWHSGSAYVFVRPLGGWADMTETAKLSPSDGASSHTFGHGVDIYDDTIVIGAPAHSVGTGAAYLFVEPVGGWASAPFPMNETAKLVASDAASGDRDGTSVAIHGSTAMFGAEYDDARAGSVYVFNQPPGGWAGILTEDQKLTASDGASSDHFGLTLAICGETAVVGAPLDDANGSVYVFERISEVWTETAKLTASDGVPNVYFGQDLACSGDIVLAGACYSVGTDLGSAYVFVKPDDGWASALYPMNEDAKLLPSDQTPYDRFGYGLGISGDTAIIGAEYSDNENGTDAGAAYVFTGLSDCNKNGTLDSCDMANCDGSPWCDDCQPNGVLDECEVPPLNTTPIGVPLEVISIPVLTPSGTDSSMILEDGEAYWLLAEGIWHLGTSGQAEDAEWWTHPPAWPNWDEHQEDLNYGDVEIDETPVDWWGCSSLTATDPVADHALYGPHLFSDVHHTYWYPVIGDGTTLHLHLVDHPLHYHDNSGTITVSIYAADEPETDCNHNGIPDECEEDTDEDGWIDDCDNCPNDYNPGQEDCDGDGIGNVCDDDIDGDGVLNGDDVCPSTPNCESLADGRPRLDINDDCEVNGLDIQIIVQQLLEGCSECE